MAYPSTLPEALVATAGRRPDHLAVGSIDGGQEYTWSGLVAASEALAGALLKVGIVPGDVAVVASAQWPELYVWYAALHRLGVIVAPLNLQFTAEENLAYVSVIQEHHRTFLVADGGMRAKLELLNSKHRFALREADATEGWDLLPPDSDGVELPPSPGPEDPIWIIATSGSTAKPKASLIPHRAAVHAGMATNLLFGATHEDRLLGVLPVFHIGGLMSHICAATLAGFSVYPLATFNPQQAYDAIPRLGVTLFTAYEAVTQRFTGLPDFRPQQMSTIRATLGSGGPSYFDLVRSWGIELVGSGYGSTEGFLITGTPATFEPLDPRRRSSVGEPTPDVDMKIIGEDGSACGEGEMGEICFKGPNVFLSYIGMPEETAAQFDDDGYFHSSDYGFMEDGVLVFRGRAQGMVKSGGENVSEIEVEEFLVNHIPGVVAVAVYGVPAAEWGEIVCAAVEWAPGAELNLEDLRDRCRDRIAGFKIPRRLEKVERGGWPIMPSGKLDKKALKAHSVNS